jgi:hypothetical protein
MQLEGGHFAFCDAIIKITQPRTIRSVSENETIVMEIKHDGPLAIKHKTQNLRPERKKKNKRIRPHLLINGTRLGRQGLTDFRLKA